MTKSPEKKELSFVVPIYNSAPYIIEKHKVLTQIINSVTESYEILFCNDASPDNSQEILEKVAKNDKNVRLLKNPENKGLGYSFRRMINESRGEIIAYTDIDLSFDVSKLGKFMDKMKDYEVVLASRYSGIESYVPICRKTISRIYWIICRIMFSVQFDDMGSGFFLIKKKCIDNIYLIANGFSVTIELYAKLHKSGCRFLEIPVVYNNNSGPASTFKLIKHSFPTIYETCLIWYDLKRKRNN